MTLITILESPIVEYRGDGVPAFARLYANQQFTTDDGILVAAGSTRNPKFYQQFVASLASNVISVEEGDAYATTNSTVRGATYTLVVYDADGRILCTPYSQLRIPNTNPTTTWQALEAFSAAVPQTYPPTYLDSLTILGLIEGMRQALEDQDSGSSLPSLANTYDNNLASAVVAIADTPTTLIIDADTTVTTPIVIPATLFLEQRNGATITFTGIGSMNFEGVGIRGDENQLFTVPVLNTPLTYSTASQVDTVNNTIGAGYPHSMTTGQMCRVYAFKHESHTAVLPTGLTEAGIYYAIVTSSTHFKLAETYAKAIANDPADITAVGSGTVEVRPINLAWTGSDYPDEVSSELVDTGDDSATMRIQILDVALPDSTAWINVHPRTFTSYACLVHDNHNIRLLKGTHDNTFAGTRIDLGYYPWVFPFVIGSNAEFTSEPSAIFMESDQSFWTELVACRVGAENSSVHHNHFEGQGALFNGVNAGVMLTNGARNCHIHDNFFDTCSSYLCSIVPQGIGDLPENCSIHHNYLKNTATQVLFIGGGVHCNITDNYVDLREHTPSSPAGFVILDLEPNSGPNHVTDCHIERNVFDVRGFTNPGGFLNAFIRINPADTRGFERLYIKDNIFLGADITGVQPANVRDGIQLIGTDQFEISGNKSYGLDYLGAIIVTFASRRGQIFNNVSTNGRGGIGVSAIETEVWGNRHYETPESGVTQLPMQIYEGYARYPISVIDGTELKFQWTVVGVNGDFSGDAFQHWTNVRGYFNNNEYTIEEALPGSFWGSEYAEDEYGRFILTETAAGEPNPLFTVPDADVDIATNAFTKVAHGLNTGALVQFFAGAGGGIGGLNSFTDYWVIRVDADHFQFALTYDDAVEGTAIDLTSVAGSGTHGFALEFVVFAYNNKFYDNYDATVYLDTYSDSQDHHTTPNLIITATGNEEVQPYYSGALYTNEGATGLVTFILREDILVGKSYRFCDVEGTSVKVQAPFATILDGDVESDLHGFIQTISQGTAFTLEKTAADKWVVTQKAGLTVTPIIAGATTINKIDMGRTVGGTVAGWEQDSLFTGGIGGSHAAFTALTTHVSNPATNAVYQTYRTAVTSFQYDWAGLDSDKAHLVRLHVVNSGIGFDTATDLTINGLQVEDNYSLKYEDEPNDGQYQVFIFEHYVPAGTTTISVDVSGPPGTLTPIASAIELYSLPDTEEYDATEWNANPGMARKDAVRDEIEAIRTGVSALTTPALGTPVSGVATNLTGTAAGLTAGNATALTGQTATVGELNQLNDVSAYQETVAAPGAISVTKVVTKLEVSGGGAVTLAAPDASMYGQQKTIDMTADTGDVTLSLANCEGQSSGTTATFNDVGDKLVLIGGASKWLVVKEFGITLA